MDFLTARILQQAEREGRFEHIPTELINLSTYESQPTVYSHHRNEWDGETNAANAFALYSPRAPDRSVRAGYQGDATGHLKCLSQRRRPSHVSNQADKLPFKDAAALRDVFDNFGLPTTYLHIADGSPAIAQCTISKTAKGRSKLEFVAHCVTKQGDWAMALSHDPSANSTSVYWSVDQRIPAEHLLEDLTAFKDSAFHPMLVPCIMFAAALEMAVRRRFDIKDCLRRLEKAVQLLHRHTSQSLLGAPEHPSELESRSRAMEEALGLLTTCRRAQASRDGRNDFWRSYQDALETGLDYAEHATSQVPTAQFDRAHDELKRWTALASRKLDSMKARNNDHIARVDIASDTLYNIVQQRDSRIQLSIAKASQRDNEDMKFIALLGSIFLPAGLIASVLNVQEFQFVGGAKLFGAYVAITVPFIVVVVTLCIARPHYKQWQERGLRGGRTERGHL